jgi:uncharacterized protein YjbJ (UPF0337 family)
MSTDKKLEQDAQDLKGHVEETAGKIFGDDKLVAHGRADQISAHAKQAATQAGETARHLGRSFKDRAMRKLGELHQQLHDAADDAARQKKASGAGAEGGVGVAERGDEGRPGV